MHDSLKRVSDLCTRFFGEADVIFLIVGLGSDCEHWVEKGRIRPRDLFDRYWAYHMECAQVSSFLLICGIVAEQ